MNFKKNKITGLLIILLISLMLMAGCTQQSQNETDPNTKVNNDDDNDDNETASVLAIVNGVNITQEEMIRTQQSYVQQGRQITPEQALEYLIYKELLIQQAEQEGYMPSDEEAEDEMETILSEQNSTLEDYKEQLAQQNVSYEEQFENFKEQLALQNFQDDYLSGFNITVTEQEARDYYDSYKEQNPENIKPYELVKDNIITSIEQQKKQDLINDLIDELREEADIQYIE